MFGPSLLVNPVTTYKATNRELYLPKGQGWYDLYTGKWQAGGKKIIADAPYERMPLYVKEGSILPFGPDIQYTSEKPADTIHLYVYTGRDASFALYEDQGTTYDYEKGRFLTIPVTYNEGSKTLTIGEQKGTYPGALTKRVFQVTTISPTLAKPLNLATKGEKEITYEGKKITVRF
jgi:alpha-D-xyloside xylohydrolase